MASEDPPDGPPVGRGPSPDRRSGSSRGGAEAPDEGFETLYKRLEETVGKLENGNLTLEESLALYEEGMSLAKRCQEILQAAELRITKLQEAYSEGRGAVREQTEAYQAASFDQREEGLSAE